MNTKHILAIDLGTSGPKVGLFAVDGTIVGGENAPVATVMTPNGGVEQRPQEWWDAICAATRALLARSLPPAAEIVGISVTGQWAGTVAVDEGGQPLMNAIIWMDHRGARHVREITKGPVSIQGYGVGRLWQWVRKTGGIPSHSGKDAVGHILYIRNERPDIYRRTYKFLEPKDYINLCLTGRFAATIDSITLHWVTDNRYIHNVRYDDQLLRLAGIDRDKLPELSRAIDVLGPLTPQAAEALGLGPHVEVIGGTPDLHSAAIGSGAVDDYAAHYYIGTSSWLSCHMPFKKTDLLHNMAALPAALPGRYFLVNEQEMAGACLTFLRDGVFHAETGLAGGQAPADFYARLDHVVAQTPPGSGRVIFTPWLNGERSPVDDHRLRGGWHNLSVRTDQSQLVRAVYEGVAYNARWLLTHVEHFIKRRLDTVSVVGGGARSDIWCQIHADILNRAVLQVSDPLHTNTRGAAFLAALGLGYLSVAEIGRRTRIERIYEPNPAHRGVYDDLYGEFLAIFKATRGIYRRLNRDL